MKPVDQQVIHRPDEGQYGDCMRAVIASLLEVGPEAVPHFLEDNCPEGSMQFTRRINDFLRPLNMGYLPVAMTMDFMSLIGLSGLHHEIAGETERGTYHACAALDGVLTHDPNPSRAGLIKAEEFGVFVVLNPSKPIGRP